MRKNKKADKVKMTTDSQQPPEWLKDLGLREWIEGYQAAYLDKLVAKSADYGSLDLELIGVGLHLAALRHDLDLEPTNEQLRGIGFYLLGKIARLISQLEAGGDPTDTLLDIHIYALMGAKIHETGEWV